MMLRDGAESLVRPPDWHLREDSLFFFGEREWVYSCCFFYTLVLFDKILYVDSFFFFKIMSS